MNKYEQIKGMANPNRGSVGVQEARPPQRTEPLIGCVNHDCDKCKERKPLTDQTIETKAANLENASSDTRWGFEQGAKWARGML